MLVKKGYLNENWKGEKPDYFMEVKTTTLYNLETPFYLSREQYKRVRIPVYNYAHHSLHANNGTDARLVRGQSAKP